MCVIASLFLKDLIHDISYLRSWFCNICRLAFYMHVFLITTNWSCNYSQVFCLSVSPQACFILVCVVEVSCLVVGQLSLALVFFNIIVSFEFVFIFFVFWVLPTVKAMLHASKT